MIELIYLETSFNITSLPLNVERFNPDSSRHIYDPHVYEEMTYKCPICENMISFKSNDFRKHSLSKLSNLSIGDNVAFDKYILLNTLEVKSFLDFYCPKCNTATKIVYSDGFGGRYGEYLVNIEFGLIKHN